MNRKRFFIFLLLLFLVSVGFYWATTPHDRGPVITGVVDGNEVTVNAKITGRIEKLTVKEGDRVRAGDLVALLDSAELAASVTAAEAAAAEARARQLESIHSFELAASSIPSKIEQAKAQVATSQAELEQAKAELERRQIDYNRIAPLADQGIFSAEQRDQARADLNSAKAAYAASQQRLAAARAALSDAEAQRQQIEAQRSEMRALAANAAEARASQQQNVARLEYTRVTAPISGVVTLRAAREGEVVNPASPIVTILDLNDMWVQAEIEESSADRITLGQSLTVRLPSGAEIAGKVNYKAAEADFATQRDVSRTKRDIRTVSFRVAIPNENERVVRGMTAYVLVPLATGGSK
jgi:HlyD family secretion protein